MIDLLNPNKNPVARFGRYNCATAGGPKHESRSCELQWFVGGMLTGNAQRIERTITDAVLPTPIAGFDYGHDDLVVEKKLNFVVITFMDDSKFAFISTGS